MAASKLHSAAKLSGTLQISTAKQAIEKVKTAEIIVEGNNLAM
jgi:hypothetical protein